jgi:hypothetical protein
MKLSMPLAALLTLSLAQGCASSPPTVPAAVASAPTSAATSSGGETASGAETASAAAAAPHSKVRSMGVAHVTEVPVEEDAPPAQGHPLTSIVVTQCNLIVAVYMTMPDGRLLRFDHSAQVSAEQLLTMAYTATRSERVEVSCNDEGVVGYEHHDQA